MTVLYPRVLANHVGGAWIPSAATQTLPDRDPATGELFAHVPLSTAVDVDAAVRTAHAAQVQWRTTSPLVRARAVMKVRALLHAGRDELAAPLFPPRLVSLVHGSRDVVNAFVRARAAKPEAPRRWTRGL